MTDSLRLSLGSPNLESAGLRDIRDLEVLGITLEMISEFETFEEDFVDNLSLLKIADWEQVKWSGDNQALAQFISANGRTPPEGISNPFILLKRYLGQPELDASWKTLNKNSIFTLSLIYDQCLIETSEELFNLKVLAGKLSS